MSIPSPGRLVAQIHASPGHAVLAVTGGGATAIGELLRVPGGSKTVLEAIVPYSAGALAEFLGARPEQYCSAKTARSMAMAAFQRTRRLQTLEEPSAETSTGHPPIGLGCTASLASDRPKRGAHRIHVASQTQDATTTCSLELEKGRRTRSAEEDLCAALILNALAESFGLTDRLTLALSDQERVESTITRAPKEWQALLLAKTLAVCAVKPGDVKCTGTSVPTSGTQTKVLFPGAFNPLHHGHIQMAEIAAQKLGHRIDFEISIENVDKPPLDYHEMHVRAAQFLDRNWPLWFTRAPTFEEKSSLFPTATFVVGADTMVRIKDERYYGGGDPAAAKAAIDRIAERGCRFLVFGRVVNGQFETLDDLKLPDNLRAIAQGVPQDSFREDISSTQLRSQAGGM